MNKNGAIKIFMNLFLRSNDEKLFHHLEKITVFQKKIKKEHLFFEGEEGNLLYFLISGNVKLYKTNMEGKEAVIHFVRHGEIFAEILLYMEKKYPVSAVALDNIEILGIDANKLFQTIKINPEIAMLLIATLADRIKYFVTMIENLTLSDTRNRFLNYLKTHKEKNKIRTVILPVPKKDIAMLLDTTPETFSRILRKLADEGFIKVHGREITLLET